MIPVPVALSGVTKQFGGLRPLRVHQLTVAAGEQVAIVGLDRPSAEVFVNLVTGAALPDTGEVTLFGRPTSAIADSTEWLAVVDRFGIVSERAVLLEQLTVVQNLAMPFTLDIEPLLDDVRARAAALAAEVGLSGSTLDSPVAALDACARMRVRLGRALALDPAVLLLEHASATLDRGAVHAFGADARAIAARRGAALIAATMDEPFARAVGSRVLRLEAATGRLKDESRRGWLRGRLG